VKTYQIYSKTVLFLSMTKEKKETERYVEMADTGAVEEEGGNTAVSADTNNTAGDTGAAPPTSLAEQLRLTERGVMVHDISGDESEDETLLDRKDNKVEGGGGDHAASAEDASAALLAIITEQEGLDLTGGDWFKTIKNAAENNVETEKELAERMKKAKISQMSQATLENKVFEGNPPTPRPADAGPAMLQKKIKKKPGSAAGTPSRPPPGKQKN
jgi:hypothetical protein